MMEMKKPSRSIAAIALVVALFLFSLCAGALLAMRDAGIHVSSLPAMLTMASTATALEEGQVPGEFHGNARVFETTSFPASEDGWG